MESQTYPGKGLSIPQLMFALDAEVNNMARSSSLTFDQLSQLAKDISTASIAILQLRNSLAPINLLPLDVLLIIPKHLDSLSDRLRVTFVCRHWRRAFVQHAPLWSRLLLIGGRRDRNLLATLLKRVKQSPLDISLRYARSPIHNLALLSSFTQQIRDLIVDGACDDHVENLSAAITGSLPLLHTLSITHKASYSPSTQTSLLFEGAANVTKFALCTHCPEFLSRFAFPNLTTLYFQRDEDLGEFPIPILLDFLEASPSLQELNLVIIGHISPEDVPLDRIIVLPHVKDFCLNLINYNIEWELATHLSCPSAEYARFWAHSIYGGYNIPEDIYPPPLPWTAISHQYTMDMIDEVELRFNFDEKVAHPTCSIFFRSTNGATLELCFDNSYNSRNMGFRDMKLGKQVGSIVFSQASKAIRGYPTLANVRRFRIQGGGVLTDDLNLAVNDAGKLLGSVGPLERLDLYECDLRPYLDAFLETPRFPHAIHLASFPPIKELTIANPIQSLADNEAYAIAVVKLAKSQHARGVPFECVRLRPPPPFWVIEELSLSVNTVECDEMLSDADADQKWTSENPLAERFTIPLNVHAR